MRSVTVFDTNAYQTLPSGLLDPLIAAERRDLIEPYADTWVAIELLGKLVNADTSTHGRAAAKKLYYHCGGGSAPRMVIDCEDQVCKMLLGRSPSGYAESRAAIGNILQRVASSREDDPLDDVMPSIHKLADHLHKVEEDRASTIFRTIVQGVVPGADSWDAIAKDAEKRTLMLASIDRGEAFEAIVDSEIRRAHITLDERIPNPIPEWMREALRKNFPYPIHFEVAMIRGVVAHGWVTSKKGRRNAVWDAQIAFNAGQTIRENGRITLVTNEDIFHKVAAATGQMGVQRLHDYLAARGIAA